jgi:hypothetical protein
MRIYAWIPIKAGSVRLKAKNFQVLYQDIELWMETYRIIDKAKELGLVQEIMISVTDEETKNHIQEQLGDNCPKGLFIEDRDYARGQTLGATISNAMAFFKLNSLWFDYLLIPQVDVVPKYTADIANLKAFAQVNSSIDYIVSVDKSGAQVGAWRLIKNPLNPEVLGQTLGFVQFSRSWIDIHYEQDLKKAQTIYKIFKGEKPQ